MNIAFVTDNGFSEKDGKYYYSGANVQHYSTIRQHFEEITFVARKSSFDHSSNLISDNYQVHLVNSITNKKGFLKNLWTLDRTLESVVKKSDIVMCFGLNGYFAYKKALKYNKPTIAYIGGCVYDTLINMDSKIKKAIAPLIMSMTKEVAKNATFVHYVDEYLVEKYPTKGEILICPSAKISTDLEVINIRTKKILEKKEEINIGLIGYTHNKIKGIDTAIKSLQILGNNYKLQVVGRGDYTWLINLSKSLGVEKQVDFLGILPGREAIFKWLDTIDVYIQPSITEGMPRATIEAISRACPVVSSHAGGLVNIIDSDFRISAGDYVGLANKIKTISENKHVMLKEAFNNFETSKRLNSDILDDKRDKFYKYIYETIS